MESIPEKVLQTTDVLCLFGFEEETIQSSLQDWLALPEKQLLFLGTETPYEMAIFASVCRSAIFLRFTYWFSSSLTKDQRAHQEKLCDAYQKIEWQIHLEASDYQDLGLAVFRNLYANLSKKADRTSFFSLKGALQGLPAVICGAGPSLKKHVSCLKQIAENSVIFAGGAALESLSFFSIPIHIGAGIDPNHSYDRSNMLVSFTSPFFFQGRFSHELLSQVQGPCFAVPSSSGLRLESCASDFEGGGTVTSFCTALALHFGCDPIIFVGMDLAYGKDLEKYAKNPISEDVQSVPMLYQGMYTQKDWVITASWFEYLISRNENISFYKLGSHGLKIEGMRGIEEPEILGLFRSDAKSIASRLHLLQTCAKEQTDLVKQKEIKESLEQSIRLVENILQLYRKSYPVDPSSQEIFTIHLFALYEQFLYKHMLEPLWKVWCFPMERKFTDSYAKSISPWLFFQRVLKEYMRSVEESYAARTL